MRRLGTAAQRGERLPRRRARPARNPESYRCLAIDSFRPEAGMDNRRNGLQFDIDAQLDFGRDSKEVGVSESTLARNKARFAELLGLGSTV